ncbi:MAG: hypothetical protein ACREQ5_04980 [Candidatus Dormibacteria bacterium]
MKLIVALSALIFALELGVWVYVRAAQPVAGTVLLTVHDASGRTITRTAHWNELRYNAGTLTLDVTTDGIFCDSLGP